MKLIKFHVTDFRSVVDSGWVDTDNVTCLIGTNESGKTNLLIPLWKLNPAKEGRIDPIADYPRKRYHEFRAMVKKPIFIEAYFELSEALINAVASITQYPINDIRVVSISRDYSGDYTVRFPEVIPIRSVPKDDVIKLLSEAEDEIKLSKSLKAEEDFKSAIISLLQNIIPNISEKCINGVGNADLEEIKLKLTSIKVDSQQKTSVIVPRVTRLQEEISALITKVSLPLPENIDQVKKLIIDNLPAFVYYSNYGNLDSEIYLPHVIENAKRDDLGVHQSAKTRTLKVLFEFVQLKPEEVLELGRDIASQPGQPTEEEIKQTSAKKKERDILLQSAGTQLTESFRCWWKQGNYRFRFQADGNHFRIWVSDDKRPEDIELEARSSGLQWFLSFYLIFLVESQNAHKGAILLLDEPGITLHPIAQRDLSTFFENLAKTNQILFTTHSPFMVDPDQLDKVKAVYVGIDGATQVSADLRITDGKEQQSRSIYPVYAALGLSISDTLLEGCLATIVEGPSDQFYLSAIKTYLIGKGIITPQRELLFLPSGGVSGIKAVIPIISGKNGNLPVVILDSDAIGVTTAKSLKNGLYKGMEKRVVSIEEYVGFPNSEIEDIFPTSFLADIITKYLRGPEEDFMDGVRFNEPIIPQVEKYAEKNEISLSTGWKVDVAKLAKSRMLKNIDVINTASQEVEAWKKLFTTLLS